MAGLVPAIHVFGVAAEEDVDARHKAGHDETAFHIPQATVRALPDFRLR